MSAKKQVPKLTSEVFKNETPAVIMTAIPLNNSSKKNDDDQDEVDRSLPLISQVEIFLNKRFEFQKNVVNEKIEFRWRKNYKLKEREKWMEANKTEKWMEANENVISRILEKNTFKYPPSKVVALLYSDFVKTFNPFIQYFNNLKYDPKSEPSYIAILLTKIKAKDQERFNLHFKKMLVRCVACATTTEMTNKNFNKHVFVIINPEQTIGKSSFIRWLCPPELIDFFIENLSMDKDGLIALSTSFFINLDELASLSKYDINQLKAKISMASINERLPYGKRRSFYPRRANFLGSTNNIEFLNDDTGNARWLCFEVDGFEPDFWKEGSENFIDINKVWSEAKYLFDSGFYYQLTLQEKNDNEIANRNYEERSVEEEMIMNFFERDHSRSESNFITTTEVLSYLVNEKFANASKVSLKKIGSVINKLGFEKGSVRGNHLYPKKGYYMKKVVGFNYPGSSTYEPPLLNHF